MLKRNDNEETGPHAQFLKAGAAAGEAFNPKRATSIPQILKKRSKNPSN
jgi:hypothetical protein